MPHIFAIVSQKGGVGKTSLTQNLGAELARAGQRVLVVDFDRQSNLTSAGARPGEHRLRSIPPCCAPEQASACVIQHRPGLEIPPANLTLPAQQRYSPAQWIAISSYKRRWSLLPSDHDVLIDGQPSLGFFTVNALAVANAALIPLECQVYAYKAINQSLISLTRCANCTRH